MRFANSLLLAFLLQLQSLLSQAQNSSASVISFEHCCHTAQDATAFALIYGYPLLSYAQFASLILTALGPNTILNEPSLSNPSVKLVVKPNVDTLYSLLFVDLSDKDVVLTVPNIPRDRYWVFPFYDPYGNQFATISNVEQSPPGEYLIRRAADADAKPGLQTSVPSSGPLSKYKGIINYPTNFGTLLGRILVFHNTTEDLNIVLGYQNNVKAKQIKRLQEQYRAMHVPALSSGLLTVPQSMSQSEQIMELLARLAPYNQPSVTVDTYRIAGILGMAGLPSVGGNYTQPAGVDLLAAEKTANATVAQAAAEPGKRLPVGNNWLLIQPEYSGNFGTHYAIRNFAAKQVYLELNPSEALYPLYLPEAATGSLSLGANEAFLITFYGKPPVMQPEGFWSLTAYDSAQFLIANPLNRYEVGDRSNITYPDGTLVYPPTHLKRGLNRRASNQEQFQILLQPQDVIPPANWTSNWLPGPEGGGQLSFILRWYAPTPAFTDGAYTYPKVEKISALK